MRRATRWRRRSSPSPAPACRLQGPARGRLRRRTAAQRRRQGPAQQGARTLLGRPRAARSDRRRADMDDARDAFRAEARAWLADELPARPGAHRDLRHGRRRGARADRRTTPVWRERMGEKGWGVPTWPTAVRRRRPVPGRGAGAGRGDGARSARANPIGGMGVMMFGPDPARIRHRGAEDAPPAADRPRRAALVPGLLRAGRRLRPRRRCRPRPRTRATTGWSTARRSGPAARNLADWCFCLVRTDPTTQARGHQLPADRHAARRASRPGRSS